MELQQQLFKTLLFMTICMVTGIFLQYGLALLILAINLVFFIELFLRNSNRNKRLVMWCVSQGAVLSTVIIVYFLSLKEQMAVGFSGGGTFSYLTNAYWNGSWRNLLNFALTNLQGLLGFSYPGIVFIITAVIGLLAVLWLKPNRTAFLLFLVPTILTLIGAMLRLYPFLGSRQDMSSYR
jgi:hypothetical protein